MSVLNVQTMRHPVDGSELRYATILSEDPAHTAEGVPLVFVPGLGGSVKNALWFLKRYAEDSGPVYSLDPRGFGLNEHLAPRMHPEQYLWDLHHCLLHLKEQDRFKIPPAGMGLSLGAVYLALYTATYDHPFGARIMMAPAFKPNPILFNFRFKFKNYSQVLFKGLKAKTTLPYGIRDLTRNPEAYDDPNFQDPLVLPTFYLFLIDRMCQKSARMLRLSDMPTAIVVPEADRICDPAFMRQCFEQMNSRNKQMFDYPGLFHDVLMEPEGDQEQVYQDLKHWLEGLELGKAMTPAR